MPSDLELCLTLIRQLSVENLQTVNAVSSRRLTMLTEEPEPPLDRIRRWWMNWWSPRVIARQYAERLRKQELELATLRKKLVRKNGQ